MIAIRDQAKAYAETQGISESEALSALLLEGMRQVDEDYAGNILANPEAASFLQQVAQSDPDNSLVSTDGKVTGFFEASDHDYGTFDAYKWQLWDVENGWYPGGVEDPNLLSQTFKDRQNILMLGEGEAYYDFRDLYQQVSGESASKAGSQNLMILGSTAGSLGAIRLAGLARTEAGLLLSNPTSYFYSQGYKLTLMADEAVAGLAGFPTGVVFGGGGAMLLDNMASGVGRYAAALLDDASSLGAFGRGVDSNPGQFRFFEVPDTTPLRHQIADLSPSDRALVESVETFRTHGVSNADALSFIQNTPEGQRLFDITLKAAGPDADLDVVLRRAAGYVETGSNAPVLREINSPLVKIVPTGGNLSGYSPFFTTQNQLDIARQSGRPLSDVFGLPAMSDGARYGVFEITPVKTTTVFESAVAPTSELGGRLTTKGGGIQYVIPDRTQFSPPTFIEVIDDNL